MPTEPPPQRGVRHPFHLAVLALAGLAAGIGCSGGYGNPHAFQIISVSVTMAGTGGGQVVASDAAVHIDCTRSGGSNSGNCSTNFDDAGGGGLFDLIPLPEPGSVFGGWSTTGRGCTTVTDSLCSMAFSGSEGDVSFSVTAVFNTSTQLGPNQLANPGFESAVAVGTQPTTSGLWRGDSAYSVGTDQGITPHGGSAMLRFIRSGLLPGAGVVSSQQWQLVDVSGLASAIDLGQVQVAGSAWFNRIAGDAETDTRFDLRVLAFSGTPAGFPADYPTPLGVFGDTVYTTGNSWQQATAGGVLPAGTRYLAVEIYAFENIFDDATDPEFDGHYADDLSLVLSLAP